MPDTRGRVAIIGFSMRAHRFDIASNACSYSSFEGLWTCQRKFRGSFDFRKAESFDSSARVSWAGRVSSRARFRVGQPSK